MRVVVQSFASWVTIKLAQIQWVNHRVSYCWDINARFHTDGYRFHLALLFHTWKL